MADTANTLTDLGVAAIRDGVKSGEFSAVDVAEAFNANVAAASALNAFIVATPEAALDAAKATGIAAEAVVDGNEQEGCFMAGQSAGMVTCEQSCREIIESASRPIENLDNRLTFDGFRAWYLERAGLLGE